MKNLTLKNVLIALAILVIIGIGSLAFAGWHGGYGHMGYGPGWMHRGYGYDSPGDYEGLSEEAIQKWNKERQAFLEQTEKVRNELYAKDRDLRSELDKENPDAQKVANMQKVISKLEAELDQKRVDHMLEMRKSNPNVGRGLMYGGSMMGYGSSRDGYCWR